MGAAFMSEQAKNDDGIGAMATLTVAIICCGTLFALTHGHVLRCRGASRSVRLQFEKRQVAMQAAAQGRPYVLPTVEDNESDQRTTDD
jgi:hypothetical protein